jgi:hypothetical protein
MSITIEDKNIRHCLRGSKKSCKINNCHIRGRYNYGKEYFYHGFCKKHYSLYQEGIIDFHGKKIRTKLQGNYKIKNQSPFKESGKRWNKEDHIRNHLRCKIVGCEKSGEISKGKMRYFKGMCSYHYREWYLKGFMDENADIILGAIGERKNIVFNETNSLTVNLIRRFRKQN